MELEQELKIEGVIKFVFFQDQDNKWRVQAVSKKNDSFESRQPLKEEWRGVK